MSDSYEMFTSTEWVPHPKLADYTDLIFNPQLDAGIELSRQIDNLLHELDAAKGKPQAQRDAAQPTPTSAWMPIETAPNDMGARLYLVGGVVVQGFVDATGVLNAQTDIAPHWRPMRGKPTHWLPLPEAP